MSQWYNAQRLYKDKWFKVWINNALETIWEHLYIPWDNKVFKYWQTTVWLPHQLTATRIRWIIDYMEHNWTTLDVFSHYYDSQMYNTYKSIYKSEYTTDYWTVYSYKFDWWQYWAKKNLVKCRIWYNIPESTWINIYVKYDNDTKNATFYTWWFENYTTPPSVWDVYKFNWIDYTITSVIRKTTSWWPTTQWLIINWVSTTPSNIDSYDYFHFIPLTKVSWDWDTSYLIDKVDYWFQLLKQLDWSKTTDTIMIRDTMPVSDFNDMQIKVDMWTAHYNITPTLYDYTLEYNIIENDFWW